MRTRRSPGDDRLSDLCTVAEAAERLGVSASTVWRWIDAGKLPALRVGPKAIRIRNRDVDGATRPHPGSEPVGELRIYTDIKDIPPMTEARRRRMLEALAAAEKFADEISTRRGGELMPDSAEIIREARDEHSAQR
jgi:excisionase family DNA binding protein